MLETRNDRPCVKGIANIVYHPTPIPGQSMVHFSGKEISFVKFVPTKKLT